MATLTETPYDEKTKERKQQFVDPKDNASEQGVAEEQASPVAQPQVVQASSVENTAVQPTQVAPQPQAVTVQPVNVEQPVQSINPSVAENDTAQLKELYPEQREVLQEDGQNLPLAQNFVTAGVDNAVVPENENVKAGTNVSAVPENIQKAVVETPAPKAPQPADEAKKRDDDFVKKIGSYKLNGNMVHTGITPVGGAAVRAAKWGNVSDDQTFTIIPWGGKTNNGGDIYFNAITSDGRVLSPDDMDAYYKKLVAASKEKNIPIEELDRLSGKLLIGTNIGDAKLAQLRESHEMHYIYPAEKEKALSQMENMPLTQLQQYKAQMEKELSGKTLNIYDRAWVDALDERIAALSQTGSSPVAAPNVGTTPPAKDAGATSKGVADAGTGTATDANKTPVAVANVANTIGTTTSPDANSSANNGGTSSTGATSAKRWSAPGRRTGSASSGSVRLESPWGGSSIDNLRLNPNAANTEGVKKEQTPKKEKRRFNKAQQARKDAAAKEMKENYKGNVDLTNRPSVDSATMKKAGYDIPDGQHATVYSSQSAFYDKSKGGEREILYTPILPDGTVMSQKDVDEYLKGLGEKGDIMELDKPENGGKGIVIGADYEPSDGPGARLHELQEEYYSSPEDYKAKADEARKNIRTNYGGGNLDPLSVKPVSKEDMEKAGWNSPLYGDMVRAHPVRQTIVDGDGNKHIVVMSPIRKDGEIIPADEFEDYVEALQSSDDIMGDDRDGYRLIIKYDASPGDEDNLFYSLPDADLDVSDDEEEEPTGEVKEYSYTNDYTDETDRMLAERVKKIEDRNAKYAEYMKDPNNSLRSVIEKAAQDQLKEEGLDPESEERLKRRRRTSGIIANIGDILQGFANMVGAWYGANSAKLSSLSAAAREGSEKQDAARQKRRDEIMKNRESALLRVEKDLDKTMQEYIKELDKANNNLLTYRMFTGKEAQRAKNREERDQRQFERNKILNKTKEKNWAKRQDRLQKDRKEMEGIRQANRLQARGYSAQKAIEVKQSPTWSQTHPKSSSSGGKGSKKSSKKGSHKSGNKRQRRSQGSLNE